MCYNITHKVLYNTSGKQHIKHPKPGFKAYFRNRIANLFRFTDDMIIEDVSGLRYRDIGSPYTLIIKIGLFYAVFMILCCFNWTTKGCIAVIFASVLLLLSHRLLRYFWTNFELIDEEGNPVEDKSLLHIVRRTKFEMWLMGTDNDNCIKYSKYNWWQKIIIFLEVLLVFGIIFMIPIITSGSPYSRLYTIELINPDLSFITELYSADGSIATPDPERGKIPLKNADTLLQAYTEARSYLDTFCPEAELTDYAMELEDGNTIYHFTFKNFRYGLLYKDDYAIMSMEVNANEDWMKVYYWGYYAIESAFGCIYPSDKEIDTESILGIIFKETGKTEDDLEYCYIGAHSIINYSMKNYDPGGDTWFAEVHFKGLSCIFFTVNVAEGTAEGVVRG